MKRISLLIFNLLLLSSLSWGQANSTTATAARMYFTDANLNGFIVTTHSSVTPSYSNGNLVLTAVATPAFNPNNQIFEIEFPTAIDIRSNPVFSMRVRTEVGGNPVTQTMRFFYYDEAGNISVNQGSAPFANTIFSSSYGPEVSGYRSLTRSLAPATSPAVNFRRIKKIRFVNWASSAFTGTMNIDSLVVGNLTPIIGAVRTPNSWVNDFQASLASDLLQQSNSDGAATLLQTGGIMRSTVNNMAWFQRVYRSTLVDTADAIDIRAANRMVVKIRSTAAITLQCRLRSNNGGENDQIFNNILGDNTWRTYTFNFAGAPSTNANNPFNPAKVNEYFFFNITNPFTGVIEFDSLRLGDAAAGPVGNDVPHTSNLIQYQGRFRNLGNSGLEFNYPGTSITAKFTGTSIGMIMGFNTFQGVNSFGRFVAIIDGNDANPITIQTNGTDSRYNIARNLSPGVHTITLIRNNGVFSRASRFLGFSLDATASLQTPDPQPRRTIQFYGDSQTDGSFMENQPSWNPTNDNNYLSYGSVAARRLNANYRGVSMGGIGLIDGFQNPFFMTTMLSRIAPYAANDSLTWPIVGDSAQIVVMNVGQNDFFRAANAQNFGTAYVDLLRRLRAAHPRANIIATLGGMNAVDPTQPWRTQIQNAVTTYRTATGDNKVYAYFLPWVTQGASSAGAHPNVQQASVMADSLVAFINRTDREGGDMWNIRGTQPGILTNVETLDFGNVAIGDDSVKNYIITSNGLTESILISVGGSFSISRFAAGPFSSSISVPRQGDTVFVRFQPTTAAPVGGNIVHESGNFNATVTVNGTGITNANDKLFSNLKVYPNPSNGIVNLQHTDATYAKAEVSITNSIGQTLVKQNFAAGNGFNAELNLSKLAKGVYTLSIQADGKLMRKMIVLQ